LLFCFFATRERVQHKVEKTPFFTQVRHLVRNDQWLVLCAVCVIGTIGYVVRGSVAAYYAKYYVGGDELMISRFLGTGVSAAILAMVASTWITKRYCKIAMFRWTQVAVAGISVVLYLAVKPGDVLPAFILYFMVSFVVDLHAPVFWSAIAEAIDYGESKTGLRVSGLAWGGISFCQKAGMAVAGAIVAQLLTYFGYVANQPQTAVSLGGIALMLSVIPGAFHLVMGLLMFKYRITDEFYVELKGGRAFERTPAPVGGGAKV
jgi:glycoside/pentoside/hexuronide:cation symporter, GPH family